MWQAGRLPLWAATGRRQVLHWRSHCRVLGGRQGRTDSSVGGSRLATGRQYGEADLESWMFEVLDCPAGALVNWRPLPHWRSAWVPPLQVLDEIVEGMSVNFAGVRQKHLELVCIVSPAHAMPSFKALRVPMLLRVLLCQPGAPAPFRQPCVPLTRGRPFPPSPLVLCLPQHNVKLRLTYLDMQQEAAVAVAAAAAGINPETGAPQQQSGLQQQAPAPA